MKNDYDYYDLTCAVHVCAKIVNELVHLTIIKIDLNSECNLISLKIQVEYSQHDFTQTMVEKPLLLRSFSLKISQHGVFMPRIPS